MFFPPESCTVFCHASRDCENYYKSRLIICHRASIWGTTCIVLTTLNFGVQPYIMNDPQKTDIYQTTFYLALSKSNFCLLTSLKLLKALLNFSASHLQIMELPQSRNQQTMSIKSWITNILDFSNTKLNILYRQSHSKRVISYPVLIHFHGEGHPNGQHILCPVVIWQRHCPDEE